MKTLALVLVASAFGTAAFAQETTIIHKDGMSGSAVVKQRSVDVDHDDAVVVQKRRVTTTGSVGCSTKTTAKTDEFGDTTVKKKTRC
jgi:hypothetical protein